MYTPFHEEGDITKAQKAGEAIANAFIVIGVVLVLTVVLVLLYKFRCYCVSTWCLRFKVLVKDYNWNFTYPLSQEEADCRYCYYK